MSCGSPPRAWGGHHVIADHHHRVRLTPTCVGRTSRTAVSVSGVAAHPHVRGEDPACSAVYRADTGSPPRAWGGPSRIQEAFVKARLTPTCVGRTQSKAPGWRPGAAHPHVRGEDRYCSPGPSALYGSPPRAWGGLDAVVADDQVDRLTPTCVGRTQPGTAGAPVQPAHPHVRGEDSPCRTNPSGTAGSPPRAWGGPCSSRSPSSRRRLTPTCVGRTWNGTHLHAGGTAHPHVRGEDPPIVTIDVEVTGSPPRAWGGLMVWGPPLTALRLTPTCVGRTHAR